MRSSTHKSHGAFICSTDLKKRGVNQLGFTLLEETLRQDYTQMDH
jgi:hypothetical protein